MNSDFFFYQGLIDFEKEKVKLEGKKEKLVAQLTKLQDSTAVPGYEEKVPEKVRTQNTEKVLKNDMSEIDIKEICGHSVI